MKPLRSLADLALFGAPPALDEVAHVGRPNVGDRAAFLRHLERALDDLWLTNDGRLVRELEARLCERLGVAECVATSSGTAALEIALRALGMTGEVALPSFTFVATANAVAWSGGHPVFCDVERGSGSVSTDSIRRRTGRATTGILGVHLYGQPCDVDELERRARELGVPLLLDASHALGSRYASGPVGGRGTAEVLSLHATKIVNAFEGGAVATNDEPLARELRLLRNHGFAAGRFERVATNAKMSEAHAAMGLVNLAHLERFVEANLRNVAAYREALDGAPGAALLVDSEATNRHYVPVVIEPETCGLSRDGVLEVLRAENVAARPYYSPGCHALPAFAGPERPSRLPETEWLSERILCLPTGLALESERAARIGEVLSFALARGDEVSRRLQLAEAGC